MRSVKQRKPLRIMGRRNPVTTKWLGHILIDGVVLRIPKFIMMWKEVTGELTTEKQSTWNRQCYFFTSSNLFWSEISGFDVATRISYKISHEGGCYIGFHWCVVLFRHKPLEIFQRYNAPVRRIFLEERLVHLRGITQCCSNKGNLITGRKAVCTFSS